jgi:hypothetical protein
MKNVPDPELHNTLRDDRGSVATCTSYRRGAGRPARRTPPGTLDPADWLALAGTPTFAVMAVLVGRGWGPSWLGEMVAMYVLMAAIHSVYWVKLMSSRRTRAPDA